MVNRQYTIRQIARKFIPFCRPYIGKYLLAIVLLVITSLLSLLPPLIFKLIIDDGIKPHNFLMVNLLAAALLVIAVLSSTARWCMEYVHEWVSARFIAGLREHLFSHILSQAMHFFGSEKIGDILGRLRTDITAVYGVLVNTFLGSLSEVVQIAGITGFLFYLNRPLAWIAVSFVPPLAIGFSYSGKVLRRLTRNVRDKDVNLLEFFQERISNIQLIKFYNRREHEEQNHRTYTEALIQAILKSVRFRFVSVSLVNVFIALAGILVVWFGAVKVIHGELSLGAFVAFYLYTVRLYAPIQSLTSRGVDIYSGLASAERIIDYLDLKPEITELRTPASPPFVRGEVAFNRVSFQYPKGDRPAVRDVTLTIRPRKKVAFVGESGAGKTTLINLLARLYDVDSGMITIDGYDVRDLSFAALYDSLAIMPQDVFLYNTTIEENIRYGKLDATREEIVEAAKRAHLHEFIQRLPNQYQTVIGPRGGHLSGGQRQRLGLSRLVLKNAPIWVLDEFTSSLDSRSEAIVYENLLPLLPEKTALIIAHRLSTVLTADQIVVMHDGKIAEIGTHEELYRKRGMYKRLFDRQFLSQAELEPATEESAAEVFEHENIP
jgi:ABC-type multidrug transport system fused ATPase/permease subunit